MKNSKVINNGSHQPVLYQQVIDILEPQSSGKYVDGTVGAGGHAMGILENSQPSGLLLALDLDKQALQITKNKLAPYANRVIIKKGSYAQLTHHLHEIGWNCVNGVLLDLGVSSIQLDRAERGFSFQKSGRLDMRFDLDQEITAEELINTLNENDLKHIIHTYGEDPFYKKITSAIISNRPIRTTTHLAEIIDKSIGHRQSEIHPATRTFQAIRIAVNKELDVVHRGLMEAAEALCPGGKLLVISFHSLEDRIVKQFFKLESSDCVCPPRQPVCTCGHKASLRIINRKVIKPSLEEVNNNPRARSAKLRAVEKIL